MARRVMRQRTNGPNGAHNEAIVENLLHCCRLVGRACRERPRWLPRRRAWLRIFVVRCGLPCDPSDWGSFTQWRDDTTLPSRGQ